MKCWSSGDVHVFRDRESCLWIATDGRRHRTLHRTQAAAIRAAMRLARRSGADVVTHDRRGRIRSKDSYGNESPVRDTEH